LWTLSSFCFPSLPCPQTALHAPPGKVQEPAAEEKRAVNEKRRKKKIGGERGKDEGGKKWAAFVRLLSSLNEKNLQRPLWSLADTACDG
jgi:hypothetical protein